MFAIVGYREKLDPPIIQAGVRIGKEGSIVDEIIRH